MKNLYDENFYQTRQNKTELSSQIILEHLWGIIPIPASAADLGCGNGVWLATIQKLGVSEVLGIDGPWVNKDQLLIANDSFQHHDLTKPLNTHKRYDLAISLEVAEHLPSNMAESFVKNLVSLSDFVLFSAAPPLQGGKNHINEQFVEYWQEIFEAQGYNGVDFLRPYFWNDERISSWYRQNVVLFVKSSRLNDLTLPRKPARLNSYLHPDIYHNKLSECYSAKGSWKILRRIFKRQVKNVFGIETVDFP